MSNVRQQKRASASQLVGSATLVVKELRTMTRRFPGALAVGLLAMYLSAPSRAAEPAYEWPARVVTIEEMHPTSALRIRFAKLVVKGGVHGPATLRAHVDAAGAVARVVLLESCGNADLDEAAIRAMSEMKFSPYTLNGVPVEVSLVVPVHVPKNLGRSR